MQPPGLPAPAFLLESPEDPACYLDGNEAMNMPSFWNFPEMQNLVGLGGLNLAAFDQGALGHPRRKPMKVSNLAAVLTLHGSRGGGFEVLAEAGDERIAQSRTWALWAPQLREHLYEGLVAYLEGFEAAYAAQNVAVKRMSAEEWRHHLQRQHVPFHRDRRTCVREMGVDKPHRRLKEHPSVYSLNVDVMGPFLEGEDSGDYKKKVRYALLATIPVPILDAVEGVASSDDVVEPGDPVVMDCLEELPEEVDCALLELVQEINAQALKGLDVASKPYKVQNLTFVEMMSSRAASDVVQALSLIHARVRATGIPLFRLHSDRAREMVSRPVQAWAASRKLRQTLTAGDDVQANGRIEQEVNQVKRRLRLLVSEASQPRHFWPTMLRQVVAERRSYQLQALHVPAPVIVPYGARVLVRQKRWQESGQLTPPFAEMTALGPSPLMSAGWTILSTDGGVQHARHVVVPDPTADQVRLELQLLTDADRCRLTGKQTVAGGPRLQLGRGLPAAALTDRPDGGESSSWQPSEGSILGAGHSATEDDLVATEGSAFGAGHSATEDDLVAGAGTGEWVLNESLEDYQRRLVSEHLDWRLVESEIVANDPLDEDLGRVRGLLMDRLFTEIHLREDELRGLRGLVEKDRLHLKALTPADGQVLQTYTVPLQTVRQNLADWVELMRDEYKSLVSSTGTVTPIMEHELKRMPEFQHAELAPCKLVTTVKAPHGKRRARVVVCGNLVMGVDGKPPQSPELLRKSAHERWDIGVGDIKTAFLLAPRRNTSQMLVTRPPKALIEAKICDSREWWIVNKALYGLNTSPSDWSAYRNSEMKTWRWKLGERELGLHQTVEPNLWALKEKGVDLMIVYVDDIMVTPESQVVQSFMECLQSHWTT